MKKGEERATATGKGLLTWTGSCMLAGTFVFGGVRLLRMSVCVAAVHCFVKLLGCELKRLWKLKGSLTALKPSACSHRNTSVELQSVAIFFPVGLHASHLDPVKIQPEVLGERIAAGIEPVEHGGSIVESEVIDCFQSNFVAIHPNDLHSKQHMHRHVRSDARIVSALHFCRAKVC